jgi:hypothetical protein
MRGISTFGLLAMLPAVMGTAPAGASMLVPICSGDGVTRTISVPVGEQGPPGQQQPGCCVKGCHAGSSRKKLQRDFDPSQ